MLRKFTALVTMLFFVTSALPVHAAGWIEKEKGTIQNVQAITKSGDNYFGVGNGSNIIRSTDNGKTWAVSDQSGNVYWQDVDSIGQTIRVVGDGGVMRESEDGGKTWTNISVGVTETLHDLDISGSSGLIVGSGGRVIRLHPSAKLWQIVTSPTTLSLQRVQIFDETNAWVVGQNGILLYTPDYGVSWSNKGKVASEDLYGVWFTSATTGYVVGKNGVFRKTTDAGVSWTDVPVSGLLSQTLYDIRGLGDRMIAVGDKVILDSTDGGTTWAAKSYSTENYRFYNTYFDADGTIWVVGTMDDVKSVVLKWEEDPSATKPPQDDSDSVLVIPSESEGSQTNNNIAPNTLIKLACAGQTTPSDPCRAVYFYGSDGKRHAFPNDKVFFSWFENFDSVKEVSPTFLSSLALGKNVTYHPGTKMVKFQSAPTVYAVSKKGVLRSVGSEEVATGLYGTDWNKKIDDISDAFFGNYSFGTKIEKTSDYDVAAEKTSVSGLDENF